MMETLLVSLMVFGVAQFSLLWYRMGKVEQLLKDHCKANGAGSHKSQK